MATTRFNGASATYTDSGSTAIFTDVGITSFSLEGGSRAEIDVTTSTSARRQSVAGFVSPRTLSLGLLLDDPTVAELDTMLGECSNGTLVIKAGVDCAAVSQILSLSVYLMSYSITAQLDGVFEVSCEFMVKE
jgi:hypothetical protein